MQKCLIVYLSKFKYIYDDNLIYVVSQCYINLGPDQGQNPDRVSASVLGQDHATDGHDHVVEDQGHVLVAAKSLDQEIDGPGTEDPGQKQDLEIENQG